MTAAAFAQLRFEIAIYILSVRMSSSAVQLVGHGSREHKHMTIFNHLTPSHAPSVALISFNRVIHDARFCRYTWKWEQSLWAQAFGSNGRSVGGNLQPAVNPIASATCDPRGPHDRVMDHQDTPIPRPGWAEQKQ